MSANFTLNFLTARSRKSDTVLYTCVGVEWYESLVIRNGKFTLLSGIVKLPLFGTGRGRHTKETKKFDNLQAALWLAGRLTKPLSYATWHKSLDGTRPFMADISLRLDALVAEAV